MSEALTPSPDPKAAAAQLAQRCAGILGEVTEMCLTLARDLHARALAAETAQEAQALALAFQRVSRGVRQSLALEVKVQRDLTRQVREADSEARADATRADLRRIARVGEHQARVGKAMVRLMWTEADGDEEDYDELDADFWSRMEEAALAPDFADTPVETLVAKFTADMNLHAAAARLAGEASPEPAPPPDPFPVGSDAWATGRAPHNST